MDLYGYIYDVKQSLNGAVIKLELRFYSILSIYKFTCTRLTLLAQSRK